MDFDQSFLYYINPKHKSKALSEHFSVDVVISIYTLSVKGLLNLAIKESNEIVTSCKLITQFSLHDINLEIFKCCLKENEKYFKEKLITKSIYTFDCKPYK